MDEILTTLSDSVWLRSELLDAGHSDRDLSRLTRAGVLRRVRRGAYVDGVLFDAADPAVRHSLLATAVVKQAKTRVIVSHVSAVPFHGGPTWGMALGTAHVTRPDGRAGRSEAGIRQHHGALLEGDVVVRDGIEVTAPTRTALDVTTCLSTEASLVLVNDFLHRGLTTADDLTARYAPMGMHPFTLKTGLVLRLADERLESVGETRTFYMCYRWGIPAPDPQHSVCNGRGVSLARLDFAWPEYGVWLEFDGREKYLKFRKEGESVTEAVLREKERESMIAELTGWRCIRLVWVDLQRPRETVARIQAMLGLVPRATSSTR